MAHVLLVNRNPETIFGARDFEDLVDKYMGSESADFYHQQITELSECIRELATYIDDKYVTGDVEEVLRANGYE